MFQQLIALMKVVFSLANWQYLRQGEGVIQILLTQIIGIDEAPL